MPAVSLGAMKQFVIAEVKVSDAAWIPAYAALVHQLVDRHGGRYLARSAPSRALEGEAPDVTIVALLEFPSLDAVTAFLEDPDYAPLQAARQAGSVSRIYSLPAQDAVGAIPYLPGPT